MIRHEDEEHERLPMLDGNRRLPKNVWAKIEMNDEAHNSSAKEETFTRLIRARIKPAYALLLIVMVAVVVLIVVVVFLFTVGKMDNNYAGTTNFSNREEFMRLYEEIIIYRTSPHLITDAMMVRLTPRQLQFAKMAGILPLDGHGTNESPFANEPPIVPVTMTPSHALNATDTDSQKSWHNEKCRIRCEKDDISIPPLLVISLDGFASEYLSRGLVPTLDNVADCGARAEHIFPSYPSKTFPNHYTIATGLYPESHGIVDNAIYDPQVSPRVEDMKRTKFSAFYGGEPIWSLAVRQHRRMFCLFWPGCSYNITGYNPTINIKYNKSMTYSSRVDRILEWLLLPAAQRPALIMAYFDQPDNVGHFHTDDRQVNLELIYIESVLNYLFLSLYKHGLLDCTNIIILSDHGMQFLNKRIYVDELIDTSGMVVANGVVGRIHIANSTMPFDTAMKQLECRDADHFTAYDRNRVPRRFHYAKSDRIGDIVLSGEPGTIFFPTKAEDYNVTSDHGYDYLTDSMRAIFFARGPNIRPGTRLKPFQNVELFNLFADLLRLDNDVPTNGTSGLLDDIYANMDQVNHEDPLSGLRPASECSSSGPLKADELLSCSNSSECLLETKKTNKWLADCAGTPAAVAPGLFYVGDASDACFISLCTKSVLTTATRSLGIPTIFHETLTSSSGPSVPASSISQRMTRRRRDARCIDVDTRFDDATCANWTAMVAQPRPRNLVWHTLAFVDEADPRGEDDEGLAGLSRLQFLAYENFVKGPLNHLRDLTRSYVRRYKRLVSITGTIYDFNNDGLADDSATYWRHQSSSTPHTEFRPTHVFRMLMRCEDGLWHVGGTHCRNASATRLLAFVLPNHVNGFDCMKPDEYLLANTARIRDIELLTNVRFFAERLWYPEREALFWKTNITEALWAR